MACLRCGYCCIHKNNILWRGTHAAGDYSNLTVQTLIELADAGMTLGRCGWLSDKPTVGELTFKHQGVRYRAKLEMRNCAIYNRRGDLDVVCSNEIVTGDKDALAAAIERGKPVPRCLTLKLLGIEALKQSPGVLSISEIPT